MKAIERRVEIGTQTITLIQKGNDIRTPDGRFTACRLKEKGSWTVYDNHRQDKDHPEWPYTVTHGAENFKSVAREICHYERRLNAAKANSTKGAMIQAAP